MNVTPEERERFYEVCEFYECSDDEIKQIKFAAKRDPDSWRECFNLLWEEVKSVKFMGRS